MSIENLFSKVLLLGSLSLSFSQADAASDFKKSGSCGSASVTSGDTCSNVKVQFNFDGCAHKSPPQLAKRVICDRQVITARFQEGNYRYEAQFQKVDDGWGGVTWKPLGSVSQFEKAQEVGAKTIGENARADRQPATTENAAPSQGASAPSYSNFKFSGFADLRYTSFSTQDNPLVASGYPESGFGLEDGAFYGNYSKDNLTVILDVAFRRSKDVDINTAATKPNQSSNANFAIGYDKSQLYLKYKLGSLFTLNFGQFDTIFGVELNDSKDRIFGKTGIVYDYTIPVTHTGAMLEFSTDGIYVKAFAANPNGKGSQGTSTTGDDKTEYGAAIGYGNDFIRGQAGYLTRSINKASGVGADNRTLMDFTLGTTLNGFSLDLEFSRVTDPSKNTLTAADAADLENAGYGMLALASYKFTDSFLIGAKYETVQDDPGALSIKSTTAIGGSVHYKLTSELELRTEYVGYDSKGVSSATWKDTRFNVAALLTF